MRLEKLNYLRNKAGVTILEGVIALGLLSIVMAGSFGVLLSSSRQTTQPDVYEEMYLAAEKAHEMLKAYTAYPNFGGSAVLTDKLKYYQVGNDADGLCENASNAGTIDLSCLLPPLCDVREGRSTFSVSRQSDSKLSIKNQGTMKWEGRSNPQMVNNSQYRDSANYTESGISPVTLRFNVKCDGYQI